MVAGVEYDQPHSFGNLEGTHGLPDFLAREAKNLVRVLPELEGPGNDAFFVYPEELRHSRRIAVVRDFLLEQVAQDAHAPGPPAWLERA